MPAPDSRDRTGLRVLLVVLALESAGLASLGLWANRLLGEVEQRAPAPAATMPARAQAPQAPVPPATLPIPAGLSLHFAPGTGPTGAAVAAIAAARDEVLVLAYGFTSAPIADALVDAHARGVVVRVVVDRSNRTARSSQAPRLAGAGVSVRYDAKHPIMHDKIIIVDGTCTLTGSFNWTGQAERNAENLLVLRGQAVAQVYSAEFREHESHSEP